MDQVIEMALKMPPSVSALFSVFTLVVLYLLGKKILAELSDQSKELRTQSTDLTAIKIQTTKTNGRVITLETSLDLHNKQDDERHEAIERKHTENKDRFEVLAKNQETILGKIENLEGGHHA